MKVSSRKKPPPQQQREETEEQGSSGAAEAMDAAAAAAVQEEAEAEAEAEEEGRTVLVGVRADAESRALLTWVLVNVAAPLDRVVAVHVAPPSAAEAVDFDAMLAVYEGFCNLKQVVAAPRLSSPWLLAPSLPFRPFRSLPLLCLTSYRHPPPCCVLTLKRFSFFFHPSSFDAIHPCFMPKCTIFRLISRLATGYRILIPRTRTIG
jgi:hypothetical protein